MIENYIGLGDSSSYHSGDNAFNDSLLSHKYSHTYRSNLSNYHHRKHQNLVDHNPIHNHKHHHKSHSDTDHRPHNLPKEKSSKGKIIINHTNWLGNINIRAAMIHIIGDIIQSIGVIIAAILIYFFPKYQIIDPLMTMFFSVIVIFTTIPIIKQCIIVVMEGTHPDFDLDDIKKILLEVRFINLH
jgi:zinc transporter 2